MVVAADTRCPKASSIPPPPLQGRPAGWGQDGRRERGGLGGCPLPNDENSRLFLGGGGGSGDDYGSQSGMGGRGCRLRRLLCDSVDRAERSGWGNLLAVQLKLRASLFCKLQCLCHVFLSSGNFHKVCQSNL